jgi:hypothetical protein
MVGNSLVAMVINLIAAGAGGSQVLDVSMPHLQYEILRSYRGFLHVYLIYNMYMILKAMCDLTISHFLSIQRLLAIPGILTILPPVITAVLAIVFR